MEVGDARQRLKLYRALDNEVRLKALKAIYDKPCMSFNEVSRIVGVERGLLAYHLGILKAAGIVSVDYQRRSRETTKYKVTQTGGELLREVFAKVASNKRHSASKTKGLPKNRGALRAIPKHIRFTLGIPSQVSRDHASVCDRYMRIRKFHRGDAPRVSRLIRKALLEVNSKDYPKKVIDFMCQLFMPRNLIEISSRRDMYVIVYEGKVLATGALNGNEIVTVFVDPRFQGMGIGTRLMDFLEGMAVKRGHSSVNLSSSVTAYSFYRKRGYRDLRVNLDEDFGKIILMRRKLTQSMALRSSSPSKMDSHH